MNQPTNNKESATDKLGRTLWRVWEGLGRTLEVFNLLPGVVVVSVYHVIQVLIRLDPWYVAIPIAMMIDLLHYRTIQRAIRNRGRGRVFAFWLTMAVVSTALAWGMQLDFYINHKVGAGETALVWWQIAMYSSIIPLGVAFMAILSETEGEDTPVLYAKLLASSSELAERLTAVEGDRQRLETQLQAGETELQLRETKLKTTETELQSIATKLQATETELQSLEGERKSLYLAIKQNRSDETLSKLHPLLRQILEADLPQNEIAAQHGVGSPKVTRLKQLLSDPLASKPVAAAPPSLNGSTNH